MSVTTWKTTSPSWKDKVTRALFCSKRKAVVNEAPEREAGIGEGLSATEAIQKYNLEKKASLGKDSLVKLLGKEKGGVMEAAKAIRQRKGERTSRKRKQKGIKKARSKVYDDDGVLLRTHSDELADKWLLEVYQGKNSEKEKEEDEEAEVILRKRLQEQKKKKGSFKGPSIEEKEIKFLTKEEKAEALLNRFEEEDQEEERNKSLASKTNSGGRPSEGGSSTKRIIKARLSTRKKSTDSDEVDYGISINPTKDAYNRDSLHSETSKNSEMEYRKFIKDFQD